MPNIKDINLLGSPLKILLVSTNGFGKTIAAASFHKQGPVHIEDADIRMKPVKAYFPDVENITYDSWTSDNFSRFVTRIHDIIDGKFIPNFKTWVIDSVTGFSITCITYQLKVKDKIKTTKGGLPATSWDEINGETVLFHEILEAAQILYTKHNCNIIFTAHPVAKTEIIKDEEAKKVMSLAAYGNKIPSIIPGFFDEIYNIQLAKSLVDGKPTWGRRAYTVPMEGMPGKTALYNYLPESMDITNKNFYDVLTSYMKPKA
jgi:hypothetical protein